MSTARRLVTLAALGLAAGWPGVAHAAPATQTIRVGAATLTVPAEWRLLAHHGAAATMALGPRERATLAVGPPIDRTLVPAALSRRGGNGAPRPARLAGYPAWRYADVTVLPSGVGVLAIACPACGPAVARVSFGGAAVLAPAPDLAFRLRLPAVLAQLDAARRTGRLALRRARDPHAQAAAARGLAAAHLHAAQALTPVSGAAQRPLLTALTDAAGAYRTLAVTAGSGSAERGARRAVARREGRLTAAVTTAVRADRFHAAPPPPATVGSGPSGALLALAAMLLGGALWLLRRRRPAPQPSAPPRVRRTYPQPARPAPPPPSPPGPSDARWDAPVA